MRQAIAIENIEEMRRLEGIEDVELWQEIRSLRAGDFVKLTLLTSTPSFTGETLLVRITSIRGHHFRGKLADTPASSDLSGLQAGSSIAFTTAHIHSVAKRGPSHEP